MWNIKRNWKHNKTTLLVWTVQHFECGARFILAASAGARRCAQQKCRKFWGNEGWFSSESKRQLLITEKVKMLLLLWKKIYASTFTDSLVLLFFLFSFWKASYLCCLPHVTLWRPSLNFFLFLFDSLCLLNVLQFISKYIIQHVVYAMPQLVRFLLIQIL